MNREESICEREWVFVCDCALNLICDDSELCVSLALFCLRFSNRTHLLYLFLRANDVSSICLYCICFLRIHFLHRFAQKTSTYTFFNCFLLADMPSNLQHIAELMFMEWAATDTDSLSVSLRICLSQCMHFTLFLALAPKVASHCNRVCSSARNAFFSS